MGKTVIYGRYNVLEVQEFFILIKSGQVILMFVNDAA